MIDFHQTWNMPWGVHFPHSRSSLVMLGKLSAIRESSKRFCASAILFFSGPSSLALAALPDDAALAFNVRAFGPDGTLQTDRIDAVGSARATKCSARLHLVAAPIRGTYAEQLDCLVAARIGSRGGLSCRRYRRGIR